MSSWLSSLPPKEYRTFYLSTFWKSVKELTANCTDKDLTNREQAVFKSDILAVLTFTNARVITDDPNERNLFKLNANPIDRGIPPRFTVCELPVLILNQSLPVSLKVETYFDSNDSSIAQYYPEFIPSFFCEESAHYALTLKGRDVQEICVQREKMPNDPALKPYLTMPIEDTGPSLYTRLARRLEGTREYIAESMRDNVVASMFFSTNSSSY